MDLASCGKLDQKRREEINIAAIEPACLKRHTLQALVSTLSYFVQNLGNAYKYSKWFDK